MKTQFIRILDVIIIAPIMIYAGIKSRDLPDYIKDLLIFFGYTTLIFNGLNFLEIQSKIKEKTGG